MEIIRSFSLAVLIVCLCSCRHNPDANSGSYNKKKLETAVFNHYVYEDRDCQKLAAAKYLFKNMDGHFSIREESYLQKIKLIGQTNGFSYFNRKSGEMSLSYHAGTGKRIMDTDVVTPEFLIKHIDSAFRQRRSYPWLSDVDDETFFEYLLPYRFLNESLDYWRDSLSIAPAAFLDMSVCDNLKYSPSLVCRHLYNDRKHGGIDGYMSRLSDTVSDVSCYSSAAANLLRYRSLGIPSAIDFIPAYANRNGSHCWVSVVSPDEKYCKLKIEPGRKVPKIYRYVYSRANPYASYENEYIPELFRNPFIKDVTDCYLYTREVTVPISRVLKGPLPELCYLAVFNSARWRPVAIAKRKRRNVTFGSIPTGNIYLPVCWQNGEWIAVNYPFVIYRNSGTVYLAPGNVCNRKMRISSKYPYNDKLNNYCKLLEGMKVFGSNDPAFKESRLLCTLRRDGGRRIYDNRLNGISKIRYLKFVSAKPYYDLSEIVLYNDSSTIIKKMQTAPYFKNITDGNPLTYIHNQDTRENELVIDLTEPVGISRIVTLPRSDGNHIYPGNIYELLYFDMGGWRSVGIEEAQDYYVEYENIPAGALYWLRCLNGGYEERIFTYTNGVLRFF